MTLVINYKFYFKMSSISTKPQARVVIYIQCKEYNLKFIQNPYQCMDKS